MTMKEVVSKPHWLEFAPTNGGCVGDLDLISKLGTSAEQGNHFDLNDTALDPSCLDLALAPQNNLTKASQDGHTTRDEHFTQRTNTGLTLTKDNAECRGGEVKRVGEVSKNAVDNIDKELNVGCRVESFGRMCEKFDQRRINWVREMGFGGLLHLRNKQLPTTLCYWLMTRVSPYNEKLIACDGKEFRLSRNQVRWILCIPKGPNQIPKKATDKDMTFLLQKILTLYGKDKVYMNKETNKMVKCKEIHISAALLDRAGGDWSEHEKFEFKTLFLLLALHMVLCPIPGPRLASDLVAAVSCAANARNFNWCGLVLETLFESVMAFAKRFHTEGYAEDCGGCGIYLAVFYLDRLNRIPLQWGAFPRLKVWSMEEILRASKDDMNIPNGEYGQLGCLDVAYGEDHPLEARDKDIPELEARDIDPPESSDGKEESSTPLRSSKTCQPRRGSTMFNRSWANKKQRSIVNRKFPITSEGESVEHEVNVDGCCLPLRVPFEHNITYNSSVSRRYH